MKNRYAGIKAFVLCIGSVALISANTRFVVGATGAGIQLGTDVTEEVAPQPADTTGNIIDPTQNIIGNDGDAENGDISTATDGPAVAGQTEQEITADSTVAYIGVDSYTIDGGLLEPGNDLTVNLTLHNISSAASAENVVITMSSASGMIYPKYGTDNQFFVGTILPGENKTISIPITVSSKLDSDVADFTCKFDYLSLGKTLSNTSTMVITTSSGKSLIVKSLDINAHAVLNGKSLLNIEYINKSNGNITDAQLIIDGFVSDDSKRIRLDTVYAGKSYTKDYNVTFTKAGDQEVKVKLVYTDVTGERLQTDLGSFSVTVSPEITSNNGYTSNVALLWGGRVLAGVGALLALFIYIKHFMKKMS
ncbi:hypothetical protein [Butyrivibrio sp. AD3002]|uniref:hypothetical protein n=1 Tax=Butyrivibrio sp. AD3002 TaxID=1280670 RepID=UPI0003B5722E|nr:hypothetical protein [Butyrivibrio sp. AD3002]